jgi:hypothetical protein
VFHRAGDFDSRMDNIVRVHAYRLRKLLETWYAGEGSQDKIRFVIPRGHYTLRIQPREDQPRKDMAAGTAQRTPAAPAPVRRKTGARFALPAGMLALGFLLGAAVVFAIMSFARVP